MVTVVFFSFTSNGPASYFGMIVNLPFNFAGTRHVCEHVPPQPYSNLPVWTFLPVASRTSSFGVT